MLTELRHMTGIDESALIEKYGQDKIRELMEFDLIEYIWGTEGTDRPVICITEIGATALNNL